eukprot:TRINITY_DN19511_c0_g1_i2.p2 TRINITY_DN19511_c0_g1~~TRINITY_DN19511_c0_g1_i2.p2  ORF type:complete len:111 (-),score=2.86 TRINITY_DN19511_c0_g1_i2:112-444(-)
MTTIINRGVSSLQIFLLPVGKEKQKIGKESGQQRKKIWKGNEKKRIWNGDFVQFDLFVFWFALLSDNDGSNHGEREETRLHPIYLHDAPMLHNSTSHRPQTDIVIPLVSN